MHALPFPEVITDPEVTLVAEPATVQILPGEPTQMWIYNGTFPGPTIRRPAGEPTRVTLVHRLPAAPEGVYPDETLTLHHHGAHSASEHDGSPLPEHVIEPGGSRTYLYEHVEGGGPERAALQWYHDHTHHRTSFNAWMGLGGLFILDDEFEASLPLPRGDYEVPLCTRWSGGSSTPRTTATRSAGDACSSWPGATPVCRRWTSRPPRRSPSSTASWHGPCRWTRARLLRSSRSRSVTTRTSPRSGSASATPSPAGVRSE